MEFYFYIILLFLAAFSILLESKLFYNWVFIPFVFVFMFIVRNEGFDSDIITYAGQFKATGLDFYYIREFVFWLGSRLIYYLCFQNELLAFIFMDFLWIIVMLKVGNRMLNYDKKNLNNALLVVLVTSFPFFLGYENIYRQFFATIFSLFAYSLIERKNYTSIFLFIIAFFMHNIIVLLLPLFILKKFFKFDFASRVQLAFICTLIFISTLTVLATLKSSEQTGIDLGIFYMLIFVCTLVVGLMFFKENIYILFDKVPSLFFVSLIMIGLVFLNIDMVSERLGMMFICFLIYDLYKYSSEIESRAIRSSVRLGLLFVFSLPTLFFENSIQFLF
jgi:hypothetical protein